MQVPRHQRIADHPPQSPSLRLPRGELVDQLLADLGSRGVAVLQGPGGSGTSWAAWQLAERWTGPVTWVRPGMWLHFADLLRPLWNGTTPPAELQTAPCEQVIDLVLAQLLETGGLLVLDDLDPCFSSGVAGVPDPELRLFLAALETGELSGSNAGVLVTAHQGPPSLSVPLRLLPALSIKDAEKLSGRSCSELPSGWLRRPGALALLAHLPPGIELPTDPSHPWPEFLASFADACLEEVEQEVLLTLALARRPTTADAISVASGVQLSTVDQCLEKLQGLALTEDLEGGWRCGRYVASAARRLLPSRLPGVLPTALMQRLAGYYLRTGQAPGQGWQSLDEASTARLGLRYAVASGDGRMALQALLKRRALNSVESLEAWRSLRDDLSLALSVPGTGLEQEEVARAWLSLADAATRIRDHDTRAPALGRALPHAQAAGDADLIRDIHTRLARHLLFTGSTRESFEHTKAALRGAVRADDTEAQCDLLNMSGSLHLKAHRLTKAQQDFELSLALSLQLGDDRRAASRRAGLGGVLIYRGRLRAAEQQLSQAAEQALECGDLAGLSHRLLNQSLVRSLRGDLPGAMALVARASAHVDPGAARLQARLLSLRGNLRRITGDLAGADDDLHRGRDAAQAADDRDALVEILNSRGHWHRSTGNFEAALEAFEQALNNTSREQEDSVLAACECNYWNAVAWHTAAQKLESGTNDTAQLREACAMLDQCHARIPDEPFRPRHVTSALQTIEAHLLASTLDSVAPLTHSYRLQQLLDENQRDPELIDTGAPEVRVLLAWALALCRRTDEAAVTAERAALDAGLAGLATVQGRARVLLGEEPDSWNGPAVLLQRLLEQAKSGPPPPSDRETGAIPLHGRQEQ